MLNTTTAGVLIMTIVISFFWH